MPYYLQLMFSHLRDAYLDEQTQPSPAAVDAVFGRDAVKDVSIEKSRRRRFARRLTRFLEVERGNFLVGARDDGEAGRARFVERDATDGEESGTNRYARGVLRLSLRFADARGNLLFVDDIAVAEPLRLGETGAEDAQLAPAPFMP